MAEEYRESQAIRATHEAANRAEREEMQRKEVMQARARLEELKKGWKAEPVA